MNRASGHSCGSWRLRGLARRRWSRATSRRGSSALPGTTSTPVLQSGQLSVGVALNVRHTAATPVGCHVRAIATYLRQEGRIFQFKVEAFDDAGPIGNGEHSRAIVDTERLVSGAERRKR